MFAAISPKDDHSERHPEGSDAVESLLSAVGLGSIPVSDEPKRRLFLLFQHLAQSITALARQDDLDSARKIIESVISQHRKVIHGDPDASSDLLSDVSFHGQELLPTEGSNPSRCITKDDIIRFEATIKTFLDQV